MLTQSKLQTIICTSKIAESEAFYRDVLGLDFSHTSEGASVFDVSGSTLRISPVPSMTPSDHTVAGFQVEDLNRALSQLTQRGLSLVKFDQFPHDFRGAVTTPEGSRVAWFHDPDKNLLSVVQFA